MTNNISGERSALPPDSRRAAKVALALCLAGCGDNLSVVDQLPSVSPCLDFEGAIRQVDDPLEVPSLVPAPAGVRAVVDAEFRPFIGASYAVPGGRLAWSTWVYHWFDGDHLGAVGRVDDTVCRWYPAHPSA
jgi:hypothetical protein